MRSLRRTLLFVPANNPKMVEKATALGSDGIILDCADSVPPHEKAKARASLGDSVAKFNRSKTEVGIRVNDYGTPLFEEDVRSAVVAGADFVDVPTVESAEEIQTAERLILQATEQSHRAGSPPGIVVLIENPKGLNRVEEILKASSLVTAVQFGAEDYLLSLGVYRASQTDLSTLYARSRLVAAAHEASVDAIDRVFTDLKDAEGLKRSALDARNMGFTGKAVIHPSQIGVVNEVFGPSQEDVAWARRVSSAGGTASDAGQGAVSVDGVMVDAVHLKMAQEIMRKAEFLGIS